MSHSSRPRAKGRAAQTNPPNRFLATYVEETFDDAQTEEPPAFARAVPTEFLPDRSQSIIAENDSPDVGFRWSINPYRGCEHGCAYCYARPTHEMLGFGAGLDFETRVMVKHDAPRLLRDALARPNWQGDVIAISGVTDCYQPAERRFRLTRGLIEVLGEAGQPFAIVTKNALVLRDLDLLAPLAERRLVHANVSVTTLDAELARTMEPRTSPPQLRLTAIARLTAAGIPVRVLVAPVIPGLTDHEMPAILQAAREAGAMAAGWVLLRLPLSVEPVFRKWLSANFPDQQARIESLVRSTRGGKLNDSHFGQRMRGAGRYAEQLAQNFQVFTRRYDLARHLPEFDHSQFRHRRAASGQKTLFD